MGNKKICSFKINSNSCNALVSNRAKVEEVKKSNIVVILPIFTNFFSTYVFEIGLFFFLIIEFTLL